MTAPFYADLSPGRCWNGRNPEALEVATASQLTERTVSSFLPAGVAALATYPHTIAFLVGGDVADAPTTATITGTSAGSTTTEVVSLVTRHEGERVASAACSEKTWSAISSIVFSAGAGTGATIAIGLGLIEGVRDVRGKIHVATMLNLLDFDGDGLVDRITLDEYAARASNEIDSVLSAPEGNFSVRGPEGRAFDFPPPPKVGDIAGDFFLAFLGARFPTVVLADHQWYAKEATRQLNELRKAYRGTGQPTAEAPANVGGAVIPSPSEPRNRPRWTGTGKFGIF